jgi:hypothetical protein
VRSDGPVAWLRSDPFPTPTTGRISVWVQLKVKDAASQPPLRLAIEGQYRGETYYRYAWVGSGPGAAPLKEQWASYVLEIDDLPVDELTDLRVGFDLMGQAADKRASEVWIDDVRVFDLYLQQKQRDELLTVVALANSRLRKGELSDLLHVLEGFWPRYLASYTGWEAANAPAEGSKPTPAPVAEIEAPSAATTFRDRMWNWVPRWR